MQRNGLRWLVLLGLALLGWAVLGLAALNAPPLHAQTDTLSLAEYQARLEQALAQLDADPSSSAAGDEESLAAARATLADVQRVQMPSGDVITLRPLLADLGDDPASRVAARERLRLVIGQIEASAGDNLAGRLTVLEEILASPVLNRRVPWWRRLWQNFVEWLEARAPDGAGSLADVSPLLQGLGWLVALGAAALLIGLLSYWLQRLLGSFTRGGGGQPRPAGDEEAITASEARQRATSLAGAGSYREAVRQLYLSTLLSLEEQGTLRRDRSLTNREVLAQLDLASARATPAGAPLSAPALRQRLHDIVDTFDGVWYGVQEPDSETFAEYERAVEAIEREMGKRGA